MVTSAARRDRRVAASVTWLDKLWTAISTWSPDATDCYGTGITIQVLLIPAGNSVGFTNIGKRSAGWPGRG